MSDRAASFVTGLIIGVGAAGLTAAAFAQGAADERAVAQVIADRQMAWNTGDADGYARLLTSDADLSSSSGQIARGRDAVIQLYLNQRAGVFAGATTSMKVVQTRMIKPDVAIVDADRELIGLKDGPAAPTARTTFVLMRQENGRWLITAQRAGTQVSSR